MLQKKTHKTAVYHPEWNCINELNFADNLTNLNSWKDNRSQE